MYQFKVYNLNFDRCIHHVAITTAKLQFVTPPNFLVSLCSEYPPLTVYLASDTYLFSDTVD